MKALHSLSTYPSKNQKAMQKKRPQEWPVHITQDQDCWIAAEAQLPTRIGDATSKFGKCRKHLVAMGEGCKDISYCSSSLINKRQCYRLFNKEIANQSAVLFICLFSSFFHCLQHLTVSLSQLIHHFRVEKYSSVSTQTV